MTFDQQWVDEVGETIHRSVQPYGYMCILMEPRKKGGDHGTSPDAEMAHLSNIEFKSTDDLADWLEAIALRLREQGVSDKRERNFPEVH